MAYIHHSHPKCDDCGERHTPGNPTECIEVLKEKLDELQQIPPVQEQPVVSLPDTIEKALIAAYKKHVLGDEDIGWDELSDMLCDALCELKGDKWYQDWVKSRGQPGGHWNRHSPSLPVNAVLACAEYHEEQAKQPNLGLELLQRMDLMHIDYFKKFLETRKKEHLKWAKMLRELASG